MSLLSGLGNLGGIGKLLDPGALVKDVVNGVLPKNMGVVGDVAGAFVDFQMGNPIGAVQHAMEAVKDLPQAAKGLQQGASNPGLLNERPQLEPSPPPLGSRAGKPFDLNELLSAIKALTAALTAHGTSGTQGQPAAAAKTATTESTSAAAVQTDATTKAASTDADEPAPATAGEGRYRHGSATLNQDQPLHAPTGGSSGWVGEPRTAPPATSAERRHAAPAAAASAPHAATAANATAAASTPETPAPAAAAPAAASTPTAGSTPPAGPSTGQTISSLSQLQTMTDSAVRDAVINGRIAPEVAKDQTAMMAVQQRMNAISEMNNLMTNMMRAVHDMQMAIIQNIRI